MADNKVVIEISATGNSEVQLKKITGAVNDLGTQGSQSLGKFQKSFEVFTGVLAAEVALKAVAALASAFTDLFKTLVTDGIKAASHQEDAINQLNTSLFISGKFTREASQGFQDFASQLQTTTKFGDETILSAAALIETLGNLEADALKPATQAAADMAAALGIDLQTAAQLVGKAAAGEVGTLSRYGLQVEKGKDAAETFANALEVLNSKFGGAAASQVNTYSGATAQLGNIIGDVKEEIGFIIINNQTLINVMRAVGEIFNKVGASIKDNRSAASDFVSNGIILIINSIQTLVTVAQTAEVIFLKLARTLVETQGGISSFTDTLTLGLTDAGERAQKSADEFVKLDNRIKELESGGGVLAGIQDALKKVENAAESGFGKSADAADRFTESANRSTAAIAKVSEEQKKLAEEGRKLAEQAVLAADPELELEKKQEALDAVFELELIDQERRDEALDVFEQQRLEKVSANNLKEVELVLEKNKQLLESDALRNEQEILANNAKVNQILANEEFTARDKLKIQRDTAAAAKKIEDERTKGQIQTLNNLAALQNSKIKELAVIGKAAAIAQATIRTYEGANLALATVPFPFGFAAAAAIIAAGIANVATIAGVDLQTGLTEVPPGFPNDSFRANLSSGERVVDANTNRDLKLFLRSQSDTSDLLMAVVDRLDRLENRTVVNIGDREIVNVIQRSLDSGRELNV